MNTSVLIIQSEQQIASKTYELYGKWFVLFGKSIDILVYLASINVNTPSDISSDSYLFYFFAKESYLNSPFSFNSIRTLMERGYYQDASNLLRAYP